MIILDTNVVSETMKIEPNPLVQNWINCQEHSSLVIVAISLAELRFGLEILHQGKRKAWLQRKINLLVEDFQWQILDFDWKASFAYGRLTAKARANGRTVDKMDGLIAAVASNRNFIVATRDTDPFAAMGVRTINPWHYADVSAHPLDHKS